MDSLLQISLLFDFYGELLTDKQKTIYRMYYDEDLSYEIIQDEILTQLISMPNVLLTSHQAFLTKEALENIAQVTLKNIEEYFAEKPLENEICYHCGKDRTTNCRKNGRCF